MKCLLILCALGMALANEAEDLQSIDGIPPLPDLPGGPDSKPCANTLSDLKCKIFKMYGWCSKSDSYKILMKQKCAVTCNLCDFCADISANCPRMKPFCDHAKFGKGTKLLCPSTCGVC